MGSTKILSLILFALTFIGTVFAAPVDSLARTLVARAPVPEKTALLEPLYVWKTGPASAGGCDAYIDNLRSSYTEAMRIAEHTLTALNIAQFKPAAAQAAGVVAAQNKIHNLLWALFKVEMGTDGKVSAPDPRLLKNNDPQGDLFTKLPAPFTSMLRYAYDSNHAGQGALVSCTSQGIRQVRPTDPDPRNPSQPMSADNEYPHGALFVAGDGKDFPGWIYSLSPDPVTGTVAFSNDMCGPAHAFTMLAKSGPDLIVFCPAGLALPTLTPSASVVEGGYLDSYISMSTVWVHELMHTWLPAIDDQTRVSRLPDIRFLNGPIPQPDGSWIVKPLDAEVRQGAYGFYGASELATYYPYTALTNIDNYTYMALGVWLDQWYWYVHGTASTSF